MKTLEEIKTILEKHKEEIRQRYKAEVIGIFGSFARREQKRRSDVDLLVKFHSDATLFDFVGLSIFLEEKLKIRNVDVVPYDALREEIKERILKETVYL